MEHPTLTPTRTKIKVVKFIKFPANIRLVLITTSIKFHLNPAKAKRGALKTAAHGRRQRRCSSLAARASRESYYYRVVCKRRGSFMRRRLSKVGWLLIVERISRTPVHCTRSPRSRNFYPKLSSVPPLSIPRLSRYRRYVLRPFADFQPDPRIRRFLPVFWNRIISPIRLGIDKLPGGSFQAFHYLQESSFLHGAW